MRQFILHGVVAGALSSLSGVIYQQVYQEAMFLDFSAVISVSSITLASFFSCILMALGYLAIAKANKPSLKGWVNVAIVFVSFASILGPLSIALPLDVDFPELFPGLAIPMHFFPATIFFGLSPFFYRKTAEF